MKKFEPCGIGDCGYVGSATTTVYVCQSCWDRLHQLAHERAKRERVREDWMRSG